MDVCIKSKLQRISDRYKTSYIESYSSDDSFGVNQIIDIYNKTEVPPSELKNFFLRFDTKVWSKFWSGLHIVTKTYSFLGSCMDKTFEN